MESVSIIAAIGSFVVSEKVIKFKASIIFGLLCIVCYDLSIHTNDPVSVRVYRGPALLALAIICTAFCLRTWRRNGVACDELLFLPGSIYAENSSPDGKGLVNHLPLNLRTLHNNASDDESDINDFVIGGENGNNKLSIEQGSSMVNVEMMGSVEKKNINENGVNCDGEMELVPLTNGGSSSPLQESSSIEVADSLCKATVPEEDMVGAVGNRASLWNQITCKSKALFLRRTSSSGTSSGSPIAATSYESPKVFRNSTSQSARGKGGDGGGGGGGIIGRFFSSQESNEYAPSGPAVASASLDLCMPVLFNFHLFIMATNYIPQESKVGNDSEDGDSINGEEGESTDPSDASIPPQVLPLIFLSILSMRAILPPKSRRRFWGTIQSAIISPFVGVSFRDELIGEILTSFVRPMQDLCFAVFYYFSSMYGMISGKVDLEDTGSFIERSLLLHNFVLPICAVLPLFCRFLQTLRQAFDDQCRWPHQGNALKYLVSSLVIVYGLTHAEEDRTNWWRLSFAFCLLFQIWWDIFVDWELLVLGVNSREESISLESVASSSASPPTQKRKWWNFCLGRIALRPKRLFKSKKTYWRIFFLNFCFRFCWMLAFIPAYHWNTRTGHMEKTSSVDSKNVMGFLISLAELIRRCCWGILRLELETIRLTDRGDNTRSGGTFSYCSNFPSSGNGGGKSRVQYTCLMPKGGLTNIESAMSPINAASNPPTHTMAMKWKAYRRSVKNIFCVELALWVVAYLGLGLCVILA